MQQEIYKYLQEIRPISLETEYSVHQKATQNRPISGQTWSVEPSYKELFLSSVKIWSITVTYFSARPAITSMESRIRILLPSSSVLRMQVHDRHTMTFLQEMMVKTYHFSAVFTTNTFFVQLIFCSSYSTY